MFTSVHAPQCQRIFCGYCGTHLSFWTEQPPTEAEYLNITLGSLRSEDIHALQELDLLPEDIEEEALRPSEQDASPAPAGLQKDEAVTRTERGGRSGDLSWFEEMLAGSRLGRTQNTRRGVGVSSDGSTRVEWEISESFDDGSGEAGSGEAATGSKRKLGDVAGKDDVKMHE